MKPMIITHCGVGSPVEYKGIAEKAGKRGLDILVGGGHAIDAVEEATVVLEDDPRLNAGIGSRLRLDGSIQMDAAIMDSSLNCGAIAAIMMVKNPVRVARRVMSTPHILLAGEGATRFARKIGFEFYDPRTEKTVKALGMVREKLKKGDLPEWAKKWVDYEFGDTVGAIALDTHGGFAAANSTGGTSIMLRGRVGDSPLVGCGLFAGKEGAVIATGVGEEIIKKVLSKHVYDEIAVDRNVQRVCDRAIKGFVGPIGVLAISRKGYGVSSSREMAYWCSEED